MTASEKRPRLSLGDVAQKLRPVFEEQQVVRAIVFGSWARGEATRRSDLDLIVVQETDKRFLDRYEGLLEAFGRALPHVDLDVLIYTPEELVQLSERPFVARALREGVVVYERH